MKPTMAPLEMDVSTPSERILGNKPNNKRKQNNSLFHEHEEISYYLRLRYKN